MENYIQFGLMLFVAAVFAFAVILHNKRKKKNYFLQNEFNNPNEPNIAETISPIKNNIVIISVWAKADSHFASYDLLQAISLCGLQYGDMNIFHYHTLHHGKKVHLFSLASATEPGEFDLNRMGDFSCKGLTLFMQIDRVPDPEVAFECMYSTAERLADELDGDLRAGQHTPWTPVILDEYREKMKAFLPA
ncbi:hypothetical protein AYO45_00110 [Gammaproteobacteria bacterium SCGC AG-212-F23]|nr:hypothetical protein AYO45_00110 [Gammaproteobacteria bacterium SCGC AG-212-F23]